MARVFTLVTWDESQYQLGDCSKPLLQRPLKVGFKGGEGEGGLAVVQYFRPRGSSISKVMSENLRQPQKVLSDD